MSKKFFIILIATAVTAGGLFASDSKSTVTVQTGRTSPADGKGMYTNYCSGCHGIDGRGKGSFSASLKQTPPNLTVLSRNNGGVYPEQHVIGVIAYGPSGHGGAGMPTWSSTLSSMDWGSGSKLETRLRISNLSKYVQTLQAK